MTADDAQYILIALWMTAGVAQYLLHYGWQQVTHNTYLLHYGWQPVLHNTYCIMDDSRCCIILIALWMTAGDATWWQLSEQCYYCKIIQRQRLTGQESKGTPSDQKRVKISRASLRSGVVVMEILQNTQHVQSDKWHALYVTRQGNVLCLWRVQIITYCTDRPLPHWMIRRRQYTKLQSVTAHLMYGWYWLFTFILYNTLV